MANLSLSGDILKISNLYIFCFLIISTIAWSQETSQKLELEKDEYQIIGKDTRVFSISGDRKSTVEFISFPLIPPAEERSIESTKGLISESEHLERVETYIAKKNLYSYLDYSLGANATKNLYGKVIFDVGNISATVNLKNRSAKENTITNMAPLSQGIEAVSYYDASFADFSLNFGLSREDDDALDINFRPDSRDVNRYRAGITMKSYNYGKWTFESRFIVKGGTFKNFVVLNDRDELILDGGISTNGIIFNIPVAAHSSAEYIKLGEQYGSILTAGTTVEWLFMDILNFRTGFDFYAFDKPDIPDKNTVTKVYPNFNTDLAITPYSFIRLNYKPGIITHSFSEIYDSNGLVSINNPILFEDRNFDFDGEFGIRSNKDLSVSVSYFKIKTRRMPVFSRFGNFFDIINNAEIDFSGYRLKSGYNRNEIWGLDGNITKNKASWDSGDVPFIPNIEVFLDGYYKLYSSWELRASMQFYGKHYVDINSDDIEDSFFTVDFGIEKKLWKQYLSMYLDFKNVTNSKGSWWTDRYKIPGTGIYFGVKAHY